MEAAAGKLLSRLTYASGVKHNRIRKEDLPDVVFPGEIKHDEAPDAFMRGLEIQFIAWSDYRGKHR